MAVTSLSISYSRRLSGSRSHRITPHKYTLVNTVILDIEQAEADVCAASVVLHKASKRVIKARDKLTAARASHTPTGLRRRSMLAILVKDIDDAESAELAAEESWESATAALEEAEANVEEA